MKKQLKSKFGVDHYLGCYGSFKREDPVCRQYCSLSIKCIVEKEQNSQLEILEDLLISEDLSIKLQ